MGFMKVYRVSRKHKTTSRMLANLLTVISIIVLLTGISVVVREWQRNNLISLNYAKLVSEANAAERKRKVPTTTSSSNPVPSTIKPSSPTLADYTVAAELPRLLIIPKLSVSSRILAVGLDANGALKTPANVYDTAWFNGSSLPGKAGAMLIDGHVSSWTTHGVFYGLKTLVPNDIIKLERGDGTMFTYQVVSSQVYDVNNVDMVSAMTSIIPNKPGLNLITCTGDIITGTYHFNERIIVFATQI